MDAVTEAPKTRMADPCRKCGGPRFLVVVPVGEHRTIAEVDRIYEGTRPVSAVLCARCDWWPERKEEVTV